MEVLALVGPAGTGKSYRASLVADRQGADVIIDDGLLIREGKILAGESAKREQTMLAAVRRALFWNAGHRAEVRQALHALNPNRVLILGTSEGMVDQVCEALEMPSPSRYIPIDEVATPAQIRRARRTRREEGKHVIPAPTVEVKKTFSGYLVDPLRFLLHRPDEADERWIEKSVVRPTFSALGKFYIADTVLATIAARAARDTEGVARVLRSVVDKHHRGVTLSLEISLKYGVPAVEVMEHVQQRVAEMVRKMTELNVLAVNVDARRLSIE